MPVAAGEAASPWMIGTPTAYVISGNVPGVYVRFDAPNKCLDYRNRHWFITNGDLEAWTAVSAVHSQWHYFLEPTKDDGEGAAEIAKKQLEVDAARRILDDKFATLATECTRAYLVVESLTDADQR